MVKKDDSSRMSVAVFIALALVFIFFDKIKKFISIHLNINIRISNYQLLGVIIFMLSGALCFCSIISFAKYIRSRKWKRIRGEVIHSKVEVERGDESVIYTPKVQFKYSVKGVKYVSSELYPFGSIGVSVKRFSMRIVNRYKPGTEVSIYCNPNNPTDSFLERKGLTPLILGFLVGLLFLMVSVLLICGIIDDHFNVLQ